MTRPDMGMVLSPDVVANPEAPAGEAYGTRAPSGRLVVMVGTRPETDLEFARRWTLWFVRDLYRGVLAQLGEDPPPATAPYRGELEERAARILGRGR